MTLRTGRETVTFARPFSLRGVDGVHPLGAYTVETDEELVDGLSFPAYRRVAGVIFLPSRPGGTVDGRMASIDLRELRAALERDALPT
ncbi:MAG TPA: hypothetical protein VFY87_28650 [Geminicoccaceae bacterium]|nr:hypothetical protein [Geminicoccaceae bacterium]